MEWSTRISAGILLIAFWIVTGSPSLAQEPVTLPEGVPPESEYAYTKHLAQVDEIMKVSDLADREKRLQSFMEKLHPKSKILQYYASFFSQTAADYEKSGNTAAASALRSKMLKMFPDSAALTSQAMVAAFNSKDYAKAIELGEKQYAGKPDAATAAILAQSYMATNNAAKAETYSIKAVEGLGSKDGISFVAWLAQHYTSQNNLPRALEYYDQMLKAFPSNAPPGWDAKEWGNRLATAYSVKASAAYQAKDFAAAVENYTQSLGYAPRNDTGYLYLGLSHWRLQQLQEAMGAFAMAVALGDSSGKAQGYLEQIYKPLNNNTTDGMDALVEKARAALP